MTASTLAASTGSPWLAPTSFVSPAFGHAAYAPSHGSGSLAGDAAIHTSGGQGRSTSWLESRWDSESTAEVMAPHPNPPIPPRSVTARGLARRQRLLDATTVLVAERGFHAVGILEIGAAAGVSGSAIYRHFANKDELLVALLDRVINELLTGAQEVQATVTDSGRALEELVDRHVEFALRDRAVIRVYDQEAHNLPPEHRARMRTNQREYARIWVDTLLALRPELTRHRAGLAVHAVFGLINSVSDHDPGVSTLEAAGVLRSMALTALRF